MTSIATKNDSVIVKDGKAAEDCSCCTPSGWYCYPPPQICGCLCRAPTRLELTIEVDPIPQFYQTTSVFGFCSHQRMNPVFPTKTFTLLPLNAYPFCAYTFNAGPISNGAITPANQSESMFSIALCTTYLIAFGAGGPSCSNRRGFPFAIHNMDILIGGVEYGPLGTLSRCPAVSWNPGTGQIAAENDTYNTPPTTGRVSLPFATVDPDPATKMYAGWGYTVSSLSSSIPCGRNFEFPIVGQIAGRLYYGTSSGTRGNANFTLNITAF